MYIYLSLSLSIYIYIHIHGAVEPANGTCDPRAIPLDRRQLSARLRLGMIRLETLIELNFLIRAFRAYPLIEIRQAIPCRAIRGNDISVNGTLPPPHRCRWPLTRRAPSAPARRQQEDLDAEIGQGQRWS